MIQKIVHSKNDPQKYDLLWVSPVFLFLRQMAGPPVGSALPTRHSNDNDSP